MLSHHEWCSRSPQRQEMKYPLCVPKKCRGVLQKRVRGPPDLARASARSTRGQDLNKGAAARSNLKEASRVRSTFVGKRSQCSHSPLSPRAASSSPKHSKKKNMRIIFGDEPLTRHISLIRLRHNVSNAFISFFIFFI